MFTLTLLSLAVAQYANSHASFKYAVSFYRRPALLFHAFKVFLMIGAVSSITTTRKRQVKITALSDLEWYWYNIKLILIDNKFTFDRLLSILSHYT